MTLIKLTQDETVRLMEASGPQNFVALSFGPGGVWLRTGESPWAVDLLAEWRSKARDSEGL